MKALRLMMVVLFLLTLNVVCSAGLEDEFRDPPQWTQPWCPVESADPFSMHLDRPNEIRFTPVKTTAVRLEVVFADAPCGIQEWLIDFY